MAKNVRYYICKHCGNLVEMVEDAGVNPVCCGQKMSELVAGEVEASREKHVPEVRLSDNALEVVVGSVLHPMAEEHSILWITLETDKGVYRRNLKAGEEPAAVFALNGESPIAVYAYCNLHGLWKKNIG